MASKKKPIVVFLCTYDAAGIRLPLTDVTINGKEYKTNEKGYRAIPLPSVGRYLICACQNKSRETLNARSTIKIVCPDGGIDVTPGRGPKAIGIDIFSYDCALNAMNNVTVEVSGKSFVTDGTGYKDGRLSGTGTYTVKACTNTPVTELIDDGYTIIVYCPNCGIDVVPPPSLRSSETSKAKAKPKAKAKAKKR